MKSWLSKAFTGVAVVTACGTLDSCSLPGGGGSYAGQTEVQTDVPESLEHGRPSRGPSSVQANTHTTTAGVPATSNLIEAPDADAPPAPPLPAKGAAGPPGGASVVGLTPESGRELIDIPKPDFNDISVHNSRPPAEMLSLGPALKPAHVGTPAAAPKTKAAPEKAQPSPSPAPAPKESVVVQVPPHPQADKNAPSEPGVPMLHSGGNLSSFYQSIHKEILEANAADNKTPGVVTPPPAADDVAVPPPPPADYAAPPAIPAKK